MTESYLARGFRHVDSAVVPKMAQCLKFLDSLPSFQSYKKLTLEALDLQPGDITADLGCGLGFDVLRAGDLIRPGGQAIGVDSSASLIESAREISQNSSAAAFIRADIHSLPFKSGAFDSCKVDRTLQHVERPDSVLREMFRTVRPGGAVVCAEPDWSTFTIDHDNRSIVREIVRLWAGSFRNPWIGRQLSHELRSVGFVGIRIQGALLVAPSFESSDKVFDIVQTAERLAEAMGNEEPLKWISNARERDQIRPVSSSVTLFVNIARRP